MKALLTGLAIVIFLGGVWVSLEFFEQRDPDYEAQFIGALDYVEKEIGRRNRGSTVLGLYAPSFRLDANTNLWLLDGTFGRKDEAGETTYQAFVAVLKAICTRPEDPECWQVEKLEVASTRNSAEDESEVPVETVPSSEGPKLERDEPETAAESSESLPPIARTSDDRVETAPLGTAEAMAEAAPAPQAEPPAEAGPGEAVLTANTAAEVDGGRSITVQQAAGPGLNLDRQTRILLIQTRLTALGYEPGPIDGQMGPRTSSAIQSYQQDHALAVDGNPSQELLNHLGREVKAE